MIWPADFLLQTLQIPLRCPMPHSSSLPTILNSLQVIAEVMFQLDRNSFLSYILQFITKYNGSEIQLLPVSLNEQHLLTYRSTFPMEMKKAEHFSDWRNFKKIE
jgi:hypothetical protein